MMKELFVEIKEVHAAPIPWPATVEGYFQYADMDFSWYGERAGMEQIGHEYKYRLYALEHSPEAGRLVFGVKDDMTPHCYDPAVVIVLDLVNRTVQVTAIEDHIQQLLEDDDSKDCQPIAIFKFL